MKHKELYTFIFLVCFSNFFAQDIRGAYIRTAWVHNTNTFTPIYEYSYTLTLLTDPLLNIARPTVTISYGDVSSGTLALSSVQNQNGITVKTYTGTHTYAGGTLSDPSSHYKAAYIDTFRVSAIKNIGSSYIEPIRIETRIYANNLFYTKSTGTITNFPPVLGIVGNNIVYDPMFNKGTSTDSVAYGLFTCYQNSSYYLPTDAIIDYNTGVLTFSKDSMGLYAFYMRIQEWGKDLSGIPQINRTTFVDFVIDINATVGLNEYKIEKRPRIFPNPFNDELNIQIPNTEDFGIQISNSLGQVILDTKDKKISTSALSSGVYFYSVKVNGEFSYSGKLIKN
jgi:hypothetical protein